MAWKPDAAPGADSNDRRITRQAIGTGAPLVGWGASPFDLPALLAATPDQQPALDDLRPAPDDMLTAVAALPNGGGPDTGLSAPPPWTPVSEPRGVWVMLTGLLGLAVCRKRHRMPASRDG